MNFMLRTNYILTWVFIISGHYSFSDLFLYWMRFDSLTRSQKICMHNFRATCLKQSFILFSTQMYPSAAIYLKGQILWRLKEMQVFTKHLRSIFLSIALELYDDFFTSMCVHFCFTGWLYFSFGKQFKILRLMVVLLFFFY